MNIIVSACLVGIKCRYDNNIKEYPGILELAKKHSLIPVCPEQLGGLPTPRESVEIRNGKVVDKNGIDYTKEFEAGAKEVLKITQLNNCNLAILKSKSPSCGFGKIYDGTFSNHLIDGNGITTDFLIKNGISIKNQDEF